MMMPPNSYHFTRLVPNKMEFIGSKYVGQYVIRRIGEIDTKTFEDGRSGLQIEITVQRQVDSIFLSTYLPTILMNSINQATNYFEDEDLFGDIIAINLTCMMVLSALYISVSGSLPATASIKYIEIWLLFNLIYPFLIVIVQTFLFLAKRQERKESTIGIHTPMCIQPWIESTSSLKSTNRGTN